MGYAQTRRMRKSWVLAILPWLGGQALCLAGDETFFESRIRPVLAAQCHSCHDAKLRMGGLDLTTAEGFRAGSATGPLLDSSTPENGRLLKAIGYDSAIRMPPSGKMPDTAIADLRTWVRSGALWPEQARVRAAAGEGNALWAFEPVVRPPVPEVRDPAWVRNPIDRFLLAAMEKHGLRPASPADPRTLLRRVTYDLTGLPPEAAEMEAFASDPSTAAYERVVERLLSSPRYGERWGRHWLDVARYADSTGVDEDHKYPYAWRYRDYVIDAFQRDLPYDQFVVEQLAGDRLPPPPGERFNPRAMIATGFLAIGPKLLAEVDKKKMLYDIVDEQIETAGKTFLGLTLNCARCHDHKFDPISTRDYYSLAGMFASGRLLGELRPPGTSVSRLYFPPLAPPEEARGYEEHEARKQALQRSLDDIKDEAKEAYLRGQVSRLGEYMVAAAAGKTPDGLDPRIVDRWSSYLKPGKDRRPHLEAWLKAKAEERQAVGAAYAKEFAATLEERSAVLARWRRDAREGKSPPKPSFPAGENRFYTEVSAPAGPFGLPKDGWERYLTADGRARLEQQQAALKELDRNAPPAPPLVCGVVDGDPVEQRVFVRGNHASPGPVAPRAVPAVLAKNGQPSFSPGSGRREFAQWVADPGNPLTARVMVNRIWMWHFGEGLVRTPNNFGVMGERPTDPALLDFLASEFVASGWSVKAMHRLILMSSAYRMSVETGERKAEIDPSNRWWSRFNRRRMDLEEIRDTLLWLEGKIDFRMGGTLQEGTGTEKVGTSVLRLGFNPDDSFRRTVYLPLRRSNLPAMFTLFDFGDASTTSDGRSRTNVAPQALFSMNSSFTTRVAGAWARRLLELPETGDEGRIRRAWLDAFGQSPSPGEVEEAAGYLRNFPGTATTEQKWRSYCRLLLASNQFIYLQ